MIFVTYNAPTSPTGLLLATNTLYPSLQLESDTIATPFTKVVSPTGKPVGSGVALIKLFSSSIAVCTVVAINSEVELS